MQLFIPDIGTLVKLEQDWTFTLYDEYRNQSLFEKLNKKRENQIVELPKGLVLKIDRIYVRKGLSQYSSITFRIPKPKNKKEKEDMPLNGDFNGVLFWVKLHEVNGTEFSIVNKNKETKELFESFYSNLEKDTHYITELKAYCFSELKKVFPEIKIKFVRGTNLIIDYPAGKIPFKDFDKFFGSTITLQE